MINARESQKKLLAAKALLMEPSTSREKFTSIRTLLQGINPRLDSALADIEKQLSTWDKIESGDVIHLTAENLPENTEEEKKRKKYLLLLIASWKQLEGEVVRVEKELSQMDSAHTTAQKASVWGRIFSASKGPLAIVTVVAVGIVVMHQTSVTLKIQNEGCATMYASGSIPISLPGLSLPTEPIPSGRSAEATLPGLTISVDGTQRGLLILTVLTYSLSFQLPRDVKNVTLNGASLLGNMTNVQLSEHDAHTLVLSCLR